jgi:predicted flap endonuclease-1-like 5' DNA nuclease
MNPYAEAYSQLMACSTPLLVSLFGALLLGILAGWTLRPERAVVPAEMTAANLALEARVKAAEEKVSLTTTEHTRMRVRMTEEREQLERTLGARQAELQALKEALVVAQRKSPLPPPTESVKVVPDPLHLARIANLERDNTRIPTLVQEVENLRKALVKKAVEQVEARKNKKEKKKRKKMLKKAASFDAPPKPPTDDQLKAISASLGRRVKRDDLQLVDGIGPKIKQQLAKQGFKTWADVAAARPDELKKALAKAGERYHMHDPSTWPEQARMMQENRWQELMKYQRKLSKAR